MDTKPPEANIQDKTVLLFGEILADVFPDRHILGGAPFNVARHLQAFGLHPVLISRTGNDPLRSEILRTMTKAGMDPQGLQKDKAHPTGQVLVHMENGNHRFEIVPEQAYDFIDADIAGKIARTVKPDFLYFGTLAQRHPISRDTLNSLCATVSCPLFLDINLREPWYDIQTLKSSLARADIVKLNKDELDLIGRLLACTTTDDKQLAAALMQEFDIKKILTTCGEAGAWIKNIEGEAINATNSRTVEVVDTVGAGDGFSAVFILGLFANWPLKQTLLRADTFARTICEIQGAVPADNGFYEPFRTAWNLTSGDLR